MKQVRYGYTFEGAYNTRKDALRVAGKHAYQIKKVAHGKKSVYYLYVLKG